MNNEIKINVPEGMEIDKENSTFECIKFKPKWIPKRGDIAAAGSDHNQIILVGEYIKQCNIVGFDIKCLAVMDRPSNILNLRKNLCDDTFWVLEEASTSEKELFIEKLNEQSYVYDPNDPRVIYKKEKELPKTWEEFCKNNPIKDGEFYVDEYSEIIETESGSRSSVDANSLPSKEYAEAMLALCKLIQLRDCYNDGWQANWTEEEATYQCIFYCKGKIKLDSRYSWHCILVFKSRELRDIFYNNFKDLIEQAKLLL